MVVRGAASVYWLPTFTSVVTMDTFAIPGTKMWTEHPLWLKDPKTTVFRETLQYARQVGDAARPAGKPPRC